MTPCLADETIAAWAAGALADDERDRAIEHAASCPLCRAVVGYLMTAPATKAQIGRYEIRGPLGAGGMGVVLRGHDPVLGREVALKMIKATLVDPAHRDRMSREAQAMAKVRHPNVVTVHELGEAGDELFVAMELVEGTLLHRWLQTPHPLAARIAVVRGIGLGIAAVHRAGLLHRDIKPENIIVRDDGTAVLVDFGLARATATPVFGAGSGIAGTPRYLAPEVAAGSPASAASDQYQWWTIVDEVLPEARRLVERGHAAEPARRFASIEDALAALDAMLARRRHIRWLAIGAAAIAVVAIAVVIAWPRREGAATCAAAPPKNWSLARRLQLEATLRAARVNPAPVLAALDRRVAQTVALRERACRAADPSARAQWSRRSVCVDETWAKTAAAVARMLASDPERVREAADALGEVAPVEACARGSLPAVPEPLEPDASKRYDAVIKTVQQLEMDSKLRPAERTAKLRALAGDIAALHYAPAESRWHWALGHTLSDGEDIPGALKEYDLSARAALAAGEDNVYVRALIMQLNLTSETASDARIAELETQAQAAALRLGQPQIDAELFRARGMMYLNRGDGVKARKALEEADALYSKIAVAPMAMHMAVLQNLGAVCLEAGDGEAAARYLDRAIEVARGRFTETGAYYWQARGARAVLDLQRKDYDRAERELRIVAAGLDRTYPDGSQAGQLRTYLCAVELARNHLPEARSTCAAAIAGIRAMDGAGSPHEVWPLAMSGQIELRAGKLSAGLAFLEQAMAIARKGNVRPIEATTAATYYAIALLAAKRTREARALAEKIAPALRAPELAEAHGDFALYFPDLAK